PKQADSQESGAGSHKQAAVAEASADKQAIENMEVHHKHHHNPPGHKEKAWKHYLFEFLMLFLAITAGFFVENLREHYVEHQREKKYVAQLLQNLKTDTSRYGRISQQMGEAMEFFDSIANVLILKKSLPDTQFVKAVKYSWSSWNLVTASTAFNQMKNSGSLRYIKNDSLSNALSEYYDHNIPRLQTFFDYINEKLHNQVEPFFAEHFNLYTDFIFTDSYAQSPEKYFDRTEKSDQIIRNYLRLYYIGVSYIRNTELVGTNEKAVNLIKLIEKEYHLK
ncbi:MAG TPA: hypothetical protein VI461_10560, partial [Chitinophagaceae bacterium]|nr:hypothetical protein [Chitinophagaceae bacterium]